MTIGYWARLDDPAGRHLYALHDDVIAGRADEILAAWDTEARGIAPSYNIAYVEAQGEARALARADQDWPADYMDREDTYGQAVMSAPLHPEFEGTVTSWHWTDEMPALPGG